MVEITLETVENDWRHREKPHGIDNRVPRILHKSVDPLGLEVTQESNNEWWIHEEPLERLEPWIHMLLTNKSQFFKRIYIRTIRPGTTRQRTNHPKIKSIEKT